MYPTQLYHLGIKDLKFGELMFVGLMVYHATYSYEVGHVQCLARWVSSPIRRAYLG